MPTMSFYSAAIAGGATSANIVLGSLHEFLKRPSMVRVGINASAVGMTARVLIGDRTVLDAMPVSLQNRFPVFPDDIILEEPGVGGERVSIFLTNTTGGPLNAWTKVDIVEL